MAKEVIIEIKAQTDNIEREVEGINQEIKTLNKNVNKTADGFEGVEKATKDTAKGIKRIGSTLKAIGIGLLLAAFTQLKTVFEQNQKVTDAFNIAFETLSIAFNDFFRFLENNLGTVTGFFSDIFENPKESLIEFGTAIKNNIIERFNSFLDTLGFLASAVKKVFARDFAGALEDVKNAGKESLDVLTGVDDTFEKSVETVTKATGAIKGYVKSTIDSATETVNLNNQVQIADALQQGLIEKYDLQAEQQRQIRDDEARTIDERIEANRKLGEILEEQEAEMLKNVELRVKAAERELAKNQDNVELKVQLIEAENELAAVQAQVAGFRSEQLTNINSLERERIDLIKEANEKEFELEMDRVKNKQMAVNAIAGLINKESAIGKIAFIAKQGLMLKEMMLTAKKALTEIAVQSAGAGVDVSKGFAKTLAAGMPQNIPLLIAYAAQAAGIISAMVSAVSKAKSAIPSAGGVNVSTPATPNAPSTPAFNIVGSSTSNQLADILAGQQQQPIQAFVVSNDISTAQELDRNIIAGASIG